MPQQQQDWFSQFEAKPTMPVLAPMPAHASTQPADWFSQFDAKTEPLASVPAPSAHQAFVQREQSRMGGINEWVKHNPGAAGAMLAGALAAPLTGGLSIGGAMVAEGAAAGAGTVAGNFAGGQPQDVSQTLVNASVGAAGPAISPATRAVLSAWHAAPEVVKEAVLHAAAHAAGIPSSVPRAVRMARMMARGLSDAAPEAAAEVTPGFNTLADARGATALRPDKYAARDAAGPVTATTPATPTTPEPWTPNPADLEAERAFKRALIEKVNAAEAARLTPVPAHTPTPRPAIGPRDYFLKKPGDVGGFNAGFGNPPAAAASDPAAAFAERFGVTADDAVQRILDSPELKSVSKANQIAIILRDTKISAETKRLAIDYIQRHTVTR